MKTKLKKFTEFAAELLPHEADYLWSIQQFEDSEKIDILSRMRENAHNQSQLLPYNLAIDKRKYSSLMQWIQSKLDAIDVDLFFEWINEMERKVTTDAITSEEEKVLLRKIRKYQHPNHNFIKFFELAFKFRHFLLIRLRYKEHQQVHAFIEQYQGVYDRCKQVNRELHEVTVDLIEQFNARKTEGSPKWEPWLLQYFNDEQLDGFNRYMIVVRLTFLYFNTREFQKLKELYDTLDGMLSKGLFYTRRILYNYYANRLMLHSKFDVLQQAEEYGYLSIRQKNPDRIQYLSNLSSILIRRGKTEEALNLLKDSFAEVNKSTNFYHKVGFISFYIKCLNLSGNAKRGEMLAESLLRIHKDDILSQRWYSFFAAYIQSLAKQGKFLKVLQVFRKYELLSKDTEDQQKAVYLPTVRWYYEIALLKEGKIDAEVLIESIVGFSKVYLANPHKSFVINKVLNELEEFIPRSIVIAKSRLS